MKNVCRRVAHVIRDPKTARARFARVAYKMLASSSRFIAKRVLFEMVARHPDAMSAVQTWYDNVSAAVWNGFNDVRQTYPAADMIGQLAIFNIRGNKYRLIVRTKGDWKRRL